MLNKRAKNFPEILEYETVKEEMAGISNRVEALIKVGSTLPILLLFTKKIIMAKNFLVSFS